MASGNLKDVGALTDVFAELRNKSKVNYENDKKMIILN